MAGPYGQHCFPLPQAPAALPAFLLMDERHFQSEEEPVSTIWSRLVQGVLGVVLIVGTGFMAHYYAPPPANDVQDEVRQLTLRVDQLKQEQAMPAMVLNRYRNSICYIFGVYQVSFRDQRPGLRARISGTGFVVADGLLATNRHVAEPWYGDPEADALIAQGATPRLEKLLAFFPGFPTFVNLTPSVLSAKGDLAVLQIADSGAMHQLRPLPLAEESPNPGELVAVIGYPMGVLGMVAKSPPAIYDRLAFRHDDMGAANELAALSLIRPSAPCGHLGDVVGDSAGYGRPRLGEGGSPPAATWGMSSETSSSTTLLPPTEAAAARCSILTEK